MGSDRCNILSLSWKLHSCSCSTKINELYALKRLNSTEFKVNKAKLTLKRKNKWGEGGDSKEFYKRITEALYDLPNMLSSFLPQTLHNCYFLYMECTFYTDNWFRFHSMFRKRFPDNPKMLLGSLSYYPTLLVFQSTYHSLVSFSIIYYLLFTPGKGLCIFCWLQYSKYY